jgi:hypothetical protein
MFGLVPATKIYINLDAVDMRKGFDGLHGLPAIERPHVTRLPP